MRSVIDHIEDQWGALTGALVQIDDGGRTVVELVEDFRTVNAELAKAVAHIEHAYDDIERVQARLHSVVRALASYLSAIGFPTSSGLTGDRPAPHRLDVDGVVRRQQRLPPPVTPNTGAKTHGVWVKSDGTSGTAISGEDDGVAVVAHYLKQVFSGQLSIETHVEMKVAAGLRATFDETGRTEHVTILLNHRPCPGRRGCAVYLPKILPVGCTVTVYGTNGYYRRFRGEHR
ncbi:DddA-like double-stranded DNA deaminase toxin [Actinokineospora bangkokensis]|uniref:DddA-like double-stranded DNA deaminase toxin n=1 Tax=Actinokineospora bangkokensis TaxID=1193682 RepID=UPI001300CE72|nr:DddA-like double-stranded DNA deaminase toxin [Actinokineospora bangkokensis]